MSENFDVEDLRRWEERLLIDAMKLGEPYTGDGIEYLDRALPYLPKYDERGWEIFGRPGDSIIGFQARDVLTKRFAWAVPTEEALAAIVKLSPIVEVGAGSGYWAKLLRERGAKVAPYDKEPYPILNMRVHRQVSYSHFPIAKGDPERALRDHPKRTLFISWPTYQSDWAARALDLHRGEHLVYIGEGYGGCTGNDRFHENLMAFYEEIQVVEIPRWFGLHDRLYVYRRLDET